MQTYHLTTAYGEYEVVIEKSRYSNNRRIALLLLDTESLPVAMATVNLGDDPCPQGHAFIKDWSENEGMLRFLLENNIVSQPVGYGHSGFCVAPLVKVLI